MTLIRAFSAVCLAGALSFAPGCDSGPTGEVEEMKPEEQAEIDKIRESYSQSGRYGPGGQNTPPEKTAPAGGTSAPE